MVHVNIRVDAVPRTIHLTVSTTQRTTLHHLLHHTLHQRILSTTQGIYRPSQARVIRTHQGVQCPAASIPPWIATCSAVTNVVKAGMVRGNRSPTPS